MEALLRLLLLLFTILYILINLDHIHALIDFHPKNSISAVAGSLKSASARTMKKDFPEQVARFYKGVSFWSNSYYVASSGGAPIEKLKEYIKNQDVPKD